MSTKRNRRRNESRFKRSGRRPGVHYKVYAKDGVAEAKYFTVETVEYRGMGLSNYWWGKQEITTKHTYARRNVPEWMIDGMMLLDLTLGNTNGNTNIPDFGEVIRIGYGPGRKAEYRYEFYKLTLPPT